MAVSVNLRLAPQPLAEVEGCKWISFSRHNVLERARTCVNSQAWYEINSSIPYEVIAILQPRSHFTIRIQRLTFKHDHHPGEGGVRARGVGGGCRDRGLDHVLVPSIDIDIRFIIDIE